MKEKIHPNYKESIVICACGNTIHTRSTKPNIRVEVCSSCHPFFTGKQKFLDSAGRVDKFIKKYAKSKQAARKKPEELSEKTHPEVKPTEKASSEVKPTEKASSEVKPTEKASPEVKPTEKTHPKAQPTEKTPPGVKPTEKTPPGVKPSEDKTPNA